MASGSLSPFLLTIMVEDSGVLLKRVKDLGLISGFERSRNKEVVTHLKFMIDTILS